MDSNSSESDDSWSFWKLLNFVLLFFCIYLLYKIIQLQFKKPTVVKRLAKMKRRDFTLQELRQYDGSGGNASDPERILVAVNGNVFDMSNARRFYGPGGPYSIFAGRDATRALATFALSEDQFRDEYDDCADLNPSQLQQVNEWESNYREKYRVVGKLLKPGQQPTVYSDEEDEAQKTDQSKKSL